MVALVFCITGIVIIASCISAVGIESYDRAVFLVVGLFFIVIAFMMV